MESAHCTLFTMKKKVPQANPKSNMSLQAHLQVMLWKVDEQTPPDESADTTRQKIRDNVSSSDTAKGDPGPPYLAYMPQVNITQVNMIRSLHHHKPTTKK